jgi:hypothetical protein
MPIKGHMARFALIMLGAWLDRTQGSGRFAQSVDDTFAAHSRAH